MPWTGSVYSLLHYFCMAPANGWPTRSPYILNKNNQTNPETGNPSAYTTTDKPWDCVQGSGGPLMSVQRSFITIPDALDPSGKLRMAFYQVQKDIYTLADRIGEVPAHVLSVGMQKPDLTLGVNFADLLGVRIVTDRPGDWLVWGSFLFTGAGVGSLLVNDLIRQDMVTSGSGTRVGIWRVSGEGTKLVLQAKGSGDAQYKGTRMDALWLGGA